MDGITLFGFITVFCGTDDIPWNNIPHIQMNFQSEQLRGQNRHGNMMLPQNPPSTGYFLLEQLQVAFRGHGVHNHQLQEHCLP